jgi:uncharacterized protein (DUF2235 family)
VKRIIICADGTWNVRDQVDDKTKKRHPSNVTKVARAIRPRDAAGIDHIVYYHDGVGTAGGLDRYTGGAFGEGIEANVRDLYRFIVYNYEDGDQLYFFGFSRGAFTVRTLAGFMNKVGLIQKDHDFYVPDLYQCYENGVDEHSPLWLRIFADVTDRRPCPPIRFIGVWDTVGALGAPGFLGQILNRNKYQYHDVTLGTHIQNAYHALAIDERRKPFAPNIWTRPPGWGGKLEQAWFPGVHSNVGGGYSPDGLANEALHWMVEKAEANGLEFDGAYLAYFRNCFNSVLEDSMTAVYRVMGEYVRPIGEHLADGEFIHKSAIDRLNLAECHYQPSNLLAFLKRNGPVTPVSTTRVVTGVPCPPLPV